MTPFAKGCGKVGKGPVIVRHRDGGPLSEVTCLPAGREVGKNVVKNNEKKYFNAF